LGNVFTSQGQWEKAAETTKAGLSLAPDRAGPYENLASDLIALQRFEEAKQVIKEARARKLDGLILHSDLYVLAFLGGDSAAMAEQQQWFADKPDYESFGLGLESATDAYFGRLRKARGLSKQAVDSAKRADSKETGATFLADAAEREAAFGNVAEARQTAAAALKLAPASRAVENEAALAFAMAGDTARAESWAQDLEKRFPLDTLVQLLWLPAIQAQLALDRKTPVSSINAVQAASPIELSNSDSCLYHVYIRGEAYLAARQGTAAAAEFQKILDHRGLVNSCSTGALAHLGVARANALESRISRGAEAEAARVRGLAAYQDFLTLWKDADPDIPILKQAKAEYARLR
jgi:hypothetical protein